MELGKWKTRLKEIAGKYRYVILILLVGMLFMIQPKIVEEETIDAAVHTEGEKSELCDQLEEILKHVDGAGNVKVMLSVDEGESTVYQTDTTSSTGEKSSDIRSQTILITDSQRNETGLIYQINPPVYKGAIILAQGADEPTIKLAIVEAVSRVTGLGANSISVLKMK